MSSGSNFCHLPFLVPGGTPLPLLLFTTTHQVSVHVHFLDLVEVQGT